MGRKEEEGEEVKGNCSKFLDLSEDVLACILGKLDAASLLMVGSAGRKLQELVSQDCVWMELCRAWETQLNLQAWRSRMDSGRALYRFLQSVGRLTGPWQHRGYDPRGELLYVTWGDVSAQGWQVLPTAPDTEAGVEFVKIFEVIGLPDGSHRVEVVIADVDEVQIPSSSAKIVLPSSQSRHFELELYDDNYEGTTTGLHHEGLPPSGVLGDTEWGEASRKKLYNRLIIDQPGPGQEVAGLWSGWYGLHGWEIVTVSYTKDDLIVATKVLGDPNVPAGEVTFKASLSRESADGGEDRVPCNYKAESIEWYMGEGRIANENFLNPAWVAGFLLVRRGGGFYFLWRGLRFRILFQRLNLEAAFKSRKVDIRRGRHSTLESDPHF